MSWIGLVIFGLLPAIGGVLAIRSILLLRHGVRVAGTILDYEVQSRSGSGSRGHAVYHFPIVRYRDHKGKTHTQTMTVSDTPVDAAARKPVRMIYPRGRPEAARIENYWSLWLLPIVLCTPAVIYGLLMALPVLMWWLRH